MQRPNKQQVRVVGGSVGLIEELSQIFGMNLEQALITLREAEAALRAEGVLHAGIFGSTARGEARPESDVDILIDLDPEAKITVYHYVTVKNAVAAFFEQPVDVIDRERLKPLSAPTSIARPRLCLLIAGSDFS